jgi:hypothetical protein
VDGKCAGAGVAEMNRTRVSEAEAIYPYLLRGKTPVVFATGQLFFLLRYYQAGVKVIFCLTMLCLLILVFVIDITKTTAFLILLAVILLIYFIGRFWVGSAAQYVVLYEEGVGFGRLRFPYARPAKRMRGNAKLEKDRPDGIEKLFSPWKDIATIEFNQHRPFQKTRRRQEDDCYGLILQTNEDNRIKMQSNRLRAYFFYPKELQTEDLLDNFFRNHGKISFDFFNMMYIILRRAYKAKWTGNVSVREWLK